MSLKNLLRALLRTPRASTVASRGSRYKPTLERLEDRLAPATFTVTNANDAGAGSLRQAVFNANATPAADTITFAASMANKTITLADTELAITQTVAIVGPGATKLTVDANGHSRIFNIDDGTSANIVVSISGLTLAHAGSFDVGDSSGIYNDETLTVTKSTLFANASNGNGGGIFNDAHGVLTLTDSTLSGNAATENGGGIYNAGTATVTNSTFSGGRSNANGGGLYNSGTAIVANATFSSNEADTNGGAMYNDATMTVTKTYLDQNFCFVDGGGIFNANGTLTFANSKLSGNTASGNGGGINNDNGTLEATNVSFLNNRAPNGNGGGIFNSGLAAALDNASFIENSAKAGGGVFNNVGTINVTNSVVNRNVGVNGAGILNLAIILLTNTVLVGNNGFSSGSGGGINNSGTATLTNVTLSDNVSGIGGGIVVSNGTLTIANSTISDNRGTTNGGGISASSSTVTLINSTISANTAKTNGGGIDATSGSTLTVTNSTIVDNWAVLGVGGGISNDASVTLFNSIVAGNRHGTSGLFTDDLADDLADNAVAGSSANNLIGSPAFSGGLIHGTNGNIVGNGHAMVLHLNAIVDPTLRNNGGPTFTHALIPDSVAIDNGDDSQVSAIPFDQRGPGFARIVGAHVDIGATEMPTAIFADDFNRADSLALGSPWIKNSGALGIVGNQAQGTGVTTVHLATLSGLSIGDADIYAKVNLDFSQQVGLVARYVGVSDTNYYLASLTRDDGGTITAKIVRNVKGVVTTLATVSIFDNVGVLRFLAVGSSLQLFMDGNLILGVQDFLIPSGSVGLRTTGATPVDDFKAFPISTGVDNFRIVSRINLGILTPPWTNTVGSFGINGLDQVKGNMPVNMVIVDGAKQPDVDVQAIVHFTGLKQSAGLVARYQGVGDKNYYLAKLLRTSTGFTAQIILNLKGVNKTLTTVNVISNTGDVSLRFRVTGTNLRVYVDNLLVANASDTSLAAGSVGIRADASATLNDLVASAVTTMLPFTDNFTQLDNDSLNVHWTPRLGGFKVSGESAVGVSTKTANLATLVGVNAPNVEVQATMALTTPKHQVGLLAAYNGAGDRNYYMAAVTKLTSGFYLSIVRNVNGIVKALAGIPVPTLTGPIKFRVQGTSLTLLMNDVQQVTAIDASLTGGGVGIRTVGTGTIDDFTATALTSTLFSDNFDTDTLDSNWVGRVGLYVNDDQHPYATDKTIGVYPLNLMTLGRVNAAEVDVQTQIDVLASLSPTEDGALIARYSGTGDKSMYMARISYTSAGFVASIVKKVNGVTTTLTSISLTPPSLLALRGTLRFTILGGKLTLFFTPTDTTDTTAIQNGPTVMLSAFDFTLKTGSVGIRSSRDTIYDNFKVNLAT